MPTHKQPRTQAARRKVQGNEQRLKQTLQTIDRTVKRVESEVERAHRRQRRGRQPIIQNGTKKSGWASDSMSSRFRREAEVCCALPILARGGAAQARWNQLQFRRY